MHGPPNVKFAVDASFNTRNWPLIRTRHFITTPPLRILMLQVGLGTERPPDSQVPIKRCNAMPHGHWPRSIIANSRTQSTAIIKSWAHVLGFPAVGWGHVSVVMRTITCNAALVESGWNVMANADAREGKWRGNWRMEWVASTLHTTSELGVSSITTADAHTSAASSRLNWCPLPI